MRRQLAGTPLSGLVIAGALLPLAMVLVPIRNSFGATNVALVLLFAVVCAGLVGGRGAGFWAAVLSGVSFNFFHTRPYLTLRIDSRRDVITVILLILAGLIFGELSVRVRERWETLARRAAALSMVQRLLDQVQAGASHDVVMQMAEALLLDDVAIAGCTFHDGAPAGDHPVLDREGRVEVVAGSIYRAGHLPIPADGLDVPVHALGRVVGHLELVGAPGERSDPAGRRLALAVSDLVGASIAVRRAM